MASKGGMRKRGSASRIPLQNQLNRLGASGFKHLEKIMHDAQGTKKTPRVLNLKTATDEEIKEAVRVDRKTKWGNPFVIGEHGTRAQVVHKHRIWLINSQLFGDLDELRGKDLLCHCAPEACHADTLLELANA